MKVDKKDIIIKGRQVCCKSFRVVPLTVLLPPCPARCKSHPEWHRMLPIKHAQNPLSKGLEAHLTAFSML